MKTKERFVEKYKDCPCATIILKNAPQDNQNVPERNETKRTVVGVLLGSDFAVGTFGSIQDRVIAIDYKKKGNLEEVLKKLLVYTKYGFEYSVQTVQTSLEECENASILTIKGFDIPSRWVVSQMAKEVMHSPVTKALGDEGYWVISIWLRQ